jgi:hypothetical protein
MEISFYMKQITGAHITPSGIQKLLKKGANPQELRCKVMVTWFYTIAKISLYGTAILI